MDKAIYQRNLSTLNISKMKLISRLDIFQLLEQNI